MKWLLDQGLPRTMGSLLRSRGHHAVHVSEVGMSCASDRDIVERARAEHCVAVTLDADFHTIVALSGKDSPSIIRIREEGLKAKGFVALIEALWKEAGNELASGCLLTYQNGKVRIRKLPLD
jgi:predicted nuclease of predicted toxin-antitoxin system